MALLGIELMDSSLLSEIPAWVSSVTGLLALIFAAVAAVFARRTFQVESGRDRVNEEERRSRHEFARRVQASHVSAWWGTQDAESGVFLRNASDTPVYQAHVVVHKADDPYGGTKMDLPVIAPSAHPVLLSVGDLPDQRVVLTFTDSDGVRWRRDEYGRLNELAAKLTFWGDRFLGPVLDRFKTDFLASYGVEVTFRTDPRWRDRHTGYVDASHAGNIDDVLDAPNDWIGNLVHNHVIEPIVISEQQRSTFKPKALEAMTYDGHLYGVPMYLFTTALIRNLDLVPTAPRTFDEVLNVGLALRNAGNVTHPLAIAVSPLGDPFHTSALYTSLGGKVFGKLPNSSWDFSRIHVADPGSIVALERMRQLGETGVQALRADVDEDEAIGLFCDGRAPFLISGHLAALRDRGVRFAVTPVPPFAGGGPATPWATATGLFVARQGYNVEIARDLLADYLARADVVDDLGPQRGAISASRLVKPPDLAIQGLERAFTSAQIMPAHPQIAKIWTWLGEMEVSTIRGEDPVASASRVIDRFASEFALCASTARNT